jgi:4'-phosphopantetheinyl transferase
MKSTIEWLFPRATPELAGNDIHVWRASLTSDQATLRGFESTLTDDERARAQRFVFESDRDHFIAAHGFLRDLLGAYLHCPPRTARFAYGPHGKPFVASRGAQSDVCFNLSHSHGVALIAIGRKRQIGIDIELIRPEFAAEEIAKRYFSAKEVDELGKLPVESRVEGFFLCWTRKEAYVKARGDGLHIPLDSFSVSVSPDAAATLSSADESRWRIESFVPSAVSEPHYVASVVAEGKDWRPRYFEWKPMQGARQQESQVDGPTEKEC